MFEAIPIGLGCAAFLSEYALNYSENIKNVVRATSRHPTIVYGFCVTLVTPLLQRVIPDLQFFNAISPGIVIGFMMTADDCVSKTAMRAVEKGIKEASLALGATRFEMVKQVVFPSAFTGIMAAIILAASRAIGETMIVVIAAGFNI